MIDVKLLYPIGSIYMSIQGTNPSVFFGGTWERIAKGKTLVGVDENDTDFNTSSKTGGEKNHTLTINEMPKHSHDVYIDEAGTGGRWGPLNTSQQSTNRLTATGEKGSSQPHNNM